MTSGECSVSCDEESEISNYLINIRRSYALGGGGVGLEGHREESKSDRRFLFEYMYVNT
jgi:hypothetical protein